MLKGIPSIISPELMRVLMEMGHGDEICIADGNFPAESMGQRVVRLDGHGTEPVLEAVLKFFPLNQSSANPVCLMQIDSDADPVPTIWEQYHQIILDSKDKAYAKYINVERAVFYARVQQCYAVVATGETALYANIILTKGVIDE